MRTSNITVVANRTVFGYGQDRVATGETGLCARAAQHLHLWHASKCALGMTMALKRLWSAMAAGMAPRTKPTCLVITGPMRPTVRPMSPVVVVT